jgi:WD40 repeat protein
MMLSSGDRSKLDPDVVLLLQTLELSANALYYDGQQLYSQIGGRIMSLMTSDSEFASLIDNCSFMKNLYNQCSSPKVPSFIPHSPSLLHSPSNFEEIQKINFFELTNGDAYFDQITRLKTGNQFVVSLSTANEEVIVWDVYEENPIRTLKGVHNPVNFKIIDDTRVVILCGRELQIYNLDDGSFVSKLKGVMNQKMPYFGLHDDNHIVALSRNRMYVNLMNLTNGECISTFKVGEDRFLNSLIVSENGKILVCGDETQKPFPLLVWDLNSKKLLYDLRIPHHEFLTNLSAITKEGHFVCCVCSVKVFHIVFLHTKQNLMKLKTFVMPGILGSR